jgi:hypothetical protein
MCQHDTVDKMFKRPSLSILHSFYRRNLVVALKRMQAITIQWHGIVIGGKASSRLVVF